jgi:hypothetical protein
MKGTLHFQLSEEGVGAERLDALSWLLRDGRFHRNLEPFQHSEHLELYLLITPPSRTRHRRRRRRAQVRHQPVLQPKVPNYAAVWTAGTQYTYVGTYTVTGATIAQFQVRQTG